MCFSAEADFISGTVITGVGIATLTQVKHPKEVPLALLPVAFGIHQLTEGFVWLGLEGEVSSTVGDAALYAYLFYAWALLPFFVPLAIYLVEPLRRRRQVMAGLLALGAFVGVYLLWVVLHNDISAHITSDTISYRGVGDSGDAITALYVVATCGSFLLSSQRKIMWFGVANIVAVAVIAWHQSEALTSLWCVWGAIVSVLIFAQFRDWRTREAAGMDAMDPAASASHP